MLYSYRVTGIVTSYGNNGPLILQMLVDSDDSCDLVSITRFFGQYDWNDYVIST